MSVKGRSIVHPPEKGLNGENWHQEKHEARKDN